MVFFFTSQGRSRYGLVPKRCVIFVGTRGVPLIVFLRLRLSKWSNTWSFACLTVLSNFPFVNLLRACNICEVWAGHVSVRSFDSCDTPAIVA